MSMFQSKIFKFNGTAWNPYHARNFLLVSEDERTFLNTIPGWADKVSSCAVVIEKAESAVVDVHSIGLIETAAVQTIPRASSQSVKEMHVVESTEIPEKSQIVTVNEKQCVEKVETVPLHSVEDVHVKSTEVEHHSPPQPVMEEHARPSEDKNNSQIMIIDSEGRVKEIETLISESEQMPAAKVSRKRKHTKDKSKKGSTSSKSARKPDIFYSDTELKSMLNCLKLCLKLV
ncbi:uncharacterized protein LOC129226146 isoform X2 [Uloborus diversus]|uniref:uncharacterized protein LOC129226146 isoform X2 n=1 Tax=Uloborus diversus TaxID=327109 RepID=UPI0024093024|nr:uncharacterized protein LOC129226146 isoform X2 [Uloborus diversus]